MLWGENTPGLTSVGGGGLPCTREILEAVEEGPSRVVVNKMDLWPGKLPYRTVSNKPDYG